MMKRLIPLVLIFMSLLLCNACEQQSTVEPSGRKVKVGIIGPFSGTDKLTGKQALDGIHTARQMQPLLLNGDVIELVVEDDKNEPSQTREALRKLAEIDEVSAVLIASASAPVLGIRSLANELETPVIALNATHPDVRKETGFISQLCFDDTMQGMVAALFVMDELLIEKVAVFVNPDSAHSSNLAAEFIREYTSIGGHITETISVTAEEEDADYIDFLKNLRDRETQLLYLPIADRNLLQVAMAASALGWEPEMMGSDGMLDSFINHYPKQTGLLEGMRGTNYFDDNTPLTTFGAQAEKRYHSLFDGVPNTYAALGIESYALLRNAMNRCKEPDNRQCINRMIRNTRNFTGVIGNISIHADGRADRPLIVTTVRNGQVEFVVKVY